MFPSNARRQLVLRPLLGAVFGVFCLSASLSPAVSQYTGPVAVETTTFGEDTFAIGLLTVANGALPSDLWSGATAQNVGFLLENLRSDYANPTTIDIIRRTLLSPGDGPSGGDATLTGKKLMALARVGFYEEAASLAELAGGSSGQPALSQAIAYAEMMRGEMAAACLRGANLQAGRNTQFWLKLRLLCYASNGEQSAADLTLGLLKDQKLLDGEESKLFTAIAIGGKPRGTIVPKTGFEYAAVRQLELPLPLEQLDQVDGAVLRALASEQKAPQQARVYAAERAHYLGILSARGVRNVFESIEFDPDRIAAAKDILNQRPDNYLVDPLVYQAVTLMTSGESTLDRAALVGEALRSARTYERFAALADVYAPLARNFEVVVNYAPYAREFALAGILSGDATLADRWISALAANQTTPAEMDEARKLLALLSLRDEGQARNIAAYSGLDFVQPTVLTQTIPQKSSPDDQVLISDLVRITLEGAQGGAGGSKGQSALVSLVAQGISASGELEDIRQIVLQQAERLAGFNGINRQLTFVKSADAMIRDGKSSSATITTGSNTADGSPTGNLVTYQPRVKPARNG